MMRCHGRLTRLERQAQTRAALLRSASQLICREGMHGASIDRIAAHAGYTKGAFYANFASKEELFLVMLEEKFDAELGRLQEAMPGSGEPTDEARKAAEGFLTYLDRDPEWPRLYQEFAAHAARDESFRIQFAARQRSLRARMADLFVVWASAYGVEPPLPPADVATMIFLIADGFLLGRIVDTDLNDDLYATMIEIFLRGLIGMTSTVQSTQGTHHLG